MRLGNVYRFSLDLQLACTQFEKCLVFNILWSAEGGQGESESIKSQSLKVGFSVHDTSLFLCLKTIEEETERNDLGRQKLGRQLSRP